MALKAFQPPDSIPVDQRLPNGTKGVHPRWSTFFNLLTSNSNNADDGIEEIKNALYANILPALSNLRGKIIHLYTYIYRRPVLSVSVDTQLQQIDSGADVDASAAAVAITLPDATKVKTRKYWVRKSDSSTNTVTVDTLLAQTINGDTSAVISFQNTAVAFRSDGANWIIS